MEITGKDYDNLVDTEIIVDVMLGHTDITVKDFLSFSEGEVLALNKAAGAGGDIYVNQRIIGTGDIIVIDEKLAIRVQDAMDSEKVVSFFFDEKSVF
ncbi:MAG: FliM/FliN family flagellar motor switch protein [Campylobacterales bacterium]|nr:FliM/FliN family flagellar motor switch protein [Campylobacterales bacterium]